MMASIKEKMREVGPLSDAAVDRMEEDERKTNKFAQEAGEAFKEGKYGKAALKAAQTAGGTAKIYAEGIPAMIGAGIGAASNALTRSVRGKKDEEPVKKRAGGKISSASKRADGCASRGKTRGRMV